jgi:hypothetical protein
MSLHFANLEITDTYRTWYLRTNQILHTAYPRSGGTVTGVLVVTGNTALQHLTSLDVSANSIVSNTFITSLLTSNTIEATSISGVLTGNTFGIHAGNVVGDTFGSHTGTVTGNVSSVTIVSSSINANTGVFTGQVSAQDFNSTSDAAFKQNISTILNASDVVRKLRGVSFEWKGTDQQGYGVVAQELEDVVPSLVSTNSDGSKSVRYNGLIGFLLESNKQLQQQVDMLKKGLDKITSELKE